MATDLAAEVEARWNARPAGLEACALYAGSTGDWRLDLHMAATYQVEVKQEDIANAKCPFCGKQGPHTCPRVDRVVKHVFFEDPPDLARLDLAFVLVPKMCAGTATDDEQRVVDAALGSGGTYSLVWNSSS